MYGSLNFGPIDMGQVTQYMLDIWTMFSPVIYFILGFAGIAALLGVIIRLVRGLSG